MKHLSILLLATFATILPLGAQQTIYGHIFDAATSQPLEGVTVFVKGTTTGAFTNADGSFRFTKPEGNETIVASYIGYEKYEIHANEEPSVSIEVFLQPEDFTLEETVIIGYATVMKTSGFCGGLLEYLEPEEIFQGESSEAIHSSWNVYPNPTHGPLSIKFNDPIDRVYLIDLSGRVLQSHRVTDLKSLQINISQYPEGVYILKGEGKALELSFKVVLSRYAINSN